MLVRQLVMCGAAVLALSGCPTGPRPGSVLEEVHLATDRTATVTSRLRLEDGTELGVADVAAGGREVVVGRLGPDGTVETRCVSSLEEAEAFLRGATQEGVVDR